MTPDYTEFERRVADVYRALGATVQHDNDVSGAQVDILVVERTKSGLDVTTAVECKYYRGVVGINEVADFAKKLDGLKRLNKAQAGVIVSEGRFSRPGRERAADEQIRLLEISDLEAQAALDLTQASLAVAEAGDRARKLQRLIGDALATTDTLSAYDWEDLHREIGKLVEQIRDGREIERRAGISSYLERRISTAVLRVEEEAERCVDSVWYLRSVARLAEDSEQLPSVAGAETDRASAALVRLREVDHARGQVRARLRRLDETVSRFGHEN